MGCAYPIKVKNPNYKSGGVKLYQREPYYFVPCGYCLACMASKRTWLTDVCNYEYNKYGCGSFTTLTYDDEHINIQGNRAVLNYKDFQDFNKRLRENLYREYGFRINYSFVVVGEYGSENERPHMHLLIFGLDWAKHDKIITESWNMGIVDNKPIKRGGITYVLKYMDKDRIRNNKHYNKNKDLRPFMKHSIGIGNDFIKEHMKEIIENYGSYSLDNGITLKPIPSYYMRKLMIYRPLDLRKTREEMLQYGWQNKKNPNEYSKNDVMEFRMYKAGQNLEKMIRTSRNEGEPQEDFDELYWETRRREMYNF